MQRHADSSQHRIVHSAFFKGRSYGLSVLTTGTPRALANNNRSAGMRGDFQRQQIMAVALTLLVVS